MQLEMLTPGSTIFGSGIPWLTELGPQEEKEATTEVVGLQLQFL